MKTESTPSLKTRPRSRRTSAPEPLEARIAPATISWDGGGDGTSWNSANNWSSNTVPGSLDDVTIDFAGVTSVTINSGAFAVKSLVVNGDDVLNISGGSLALTSVSSIAHLNLTGGTLDSTALTTIVDGTFSNEAVLQGLERVTGVFSITGGSPNVRGTVEVTGKIAHGDAYLDFDTAGARVKVLGGGIYETVNVSGGYGVRQFGGGYGVSVESGGTFRTSGASFQFNVGNAPTFDVNGGTVEVTGGPLLLNTGGTFTNALLKASAGKSLVFTNTTSIAVVGTLTGIGAGTVSLQDNAVITADAAGATLAFAPGVLQWSGEAAMTGGTFTNTGTIQIAGGSPNLRTLLRDAGTILHGDSYFDFDLAGGKVQVLNGGLYEVVTPSSNYGLRQFADGYGVVVESGGVFRVSGGGAFYANVGNAPTFNVNGGTVEVMGGLFYLNTGGTFTNATLKVAAGKSLIFTNTTNIAVVGTLTGMGAGTVSLQDNAIFTADAAGTTLAFAPGVLQWSGEAVLAGGTFTNTGTIQIAGGSPNLRTLLRDAGTILHGDAYLDFDAVGGKVQVLNGGLYEAVTPASGYGFRQFGGGYGVSVENGGVFRVSGGGTFYANLGNAPTFDVNGGRVDVTGGVLTINTGGTFTNALLTVATGKSLVFTNTTSIAITGTLTGTGAGTVSFQDNAIFTANAAGATLAFVPGMLQWSGEAVLAGGTFTNTGTIKVAGGAPNVRTVLRNAGTITQGEAYLDFDAAGAELRVLSGSLYETVNVGSGYGFRQFSGGLGETVESGGTFRVSGPGAFYTNTGNNPAFNVLGGTVDVTGGPLYINSNGTFTNALLTVAAGKQMVFTNTATIALAGTLKGAGGGTVSLQDGAVWSADVAGVTLDFPLGLLSWSGEAAISGPGVVVNVNAITATAGSPNLRTELQNFGTLNIIETYFDFDAAGGKLRVLAGGLVEASNTGSGYGFRQFNGGQGISVESGGTFRHSGTGAFYANTGNDPAFNVLGGTVEVTSSGAFYLNSTATLASATLNVSTGASLILTGPNTTISGTLTGSGAGVVSLQDNGALNIAASGAKLDFAAGYFSWSGEGSIGGSGVVENVGFISVTGGSPNLRTELQNSGTITQGEAYFDLDAATAKLRILSGGQFLVANIGSGYTMRGFNGPVGVVVESGGLFARTGANYFGVDGNVPLTNHGTVEARTGTLQISNITQLAANGATLGGDGLWEVQAGATLTLGSGTALTNNAAKIRVHGTGAFSGLGTTFTQNSGSLELLDGADLTLSGALQNSGSIFLSAGSVLTVNGAGFTQTAAGRVQFEIAGTTASALGRLVSAGPATLNGFAAGSISGGFGLQAGQTFPLMSFPSHTGDFIGLDRNYAAGRQKLFDAVTTATTFSLSSLVDAADLDVVTVTAPTIGGPGQVVTINYTVANLSTGATFTDSWVDSIYLSLDDTLDSSDRLIGRAPHSGVVAGNGGSYAGSLTAPLPAVVPGDYRVIVVADSQGRTPDLNRANNTEHAPGLIAIDIPLLTDGVAVNGTIADGQSVFYRVNLPGAATRSFFANLVTKGQAELFVRYADTPLPDHSDGYAFSTSVEDARVLLPNGPAGTYYIELRGRSAAGAGSSFSLLAETLGFTVLGLDRTKAQNLGDVTVEIDGSRFTTDTAFDLVSPTGQAIHSSALFFAGGAKVFATFHLTGAATGLYDVRAMDGVAVDTLNDALLVQNGGRAGDLEFRLDVPRYIRPNGRVGIATIEYYNAGDSDIPAQLLLLSGADTYFRLPGEQSFKSDGLQFFATNDKGLAGVLPPGAHVTMQVEFLPKSFEPHGLTDITLTQYLDSAPMNWDDLSASLRPVGTSDAAWAVVLANFKAHVGNTAGSLNTAASQDLNYLSTIGNAPRDLDEVLKFETLLADNYGEISARFKGGAFGLGQADPNEFKARALPGGVVRVGELDSFIAFVLERGNYRNITGDGSKLATIGSNLLLTKSDGTKVTLDKTTGRLKSIQQVSGDTLTASYNAAGLLSDYTLSTGDTIHITYNGAGLATAVDGPGTRHTGFTYTDGRLTSRIEAGGTTAYTYVTTAGSAALNALASITFADGTSRSFSYDTIGRTASVTQPGGTTSFTYPGPAQLKIVTPTGGETTTFYTFSGQIARIFDGDGNTVALGYDKGGNLTSATTPDGGLTTLTKAIAGGSSTITNADGVHTRTDYDLNGNVIALVDGRGDTTKYLRDSIGRVTNIVFPDGSRESYTYNSDGNISLLVNRRGETIRYSTEPDGTLTGIDYVDLPALRYTYDANDHPVSISSSGITTVIVYDSASRVTQVDLGNGHTLAYTYNSKGQLTALTEDNGFAVHYSYTASGQIDDVRDAANALLVDYTYDATGQLTRKDYANGTATVFTYDAYSRVTSITHRGAGNVLLASFAYTFDANGRRDTMTTVEGVTHYGYDLSGELNSVQLPSGRLIKYVYDAAGNRKQVNDNGTLTNFTANNLDAYTSAGAATFTYDAAGNPLTRTDAGGTTHYRYDSLGRVMSTTGPDGTSTYEYNSLGQIAALVQNGERHQYIYDPTDPGRILAEYNGNGVLVSHYIPGAVGMEAQVTASGEFRAFGFDGSGNTALITGAGGAVLNSYRYLPFGEVLSRTETVDNAFEFVGQYGVIATGNGQNFAGVRLYDPGLGRFISPDPRPQPGQNLYAYTGNQPVNRVDFTGFDLVGDIGNVSTPTSAVNSTMGFVVDSVQGVRTVFAQAEVNITGQGITNALHNGGPDQLEAAQKTFGKAVDARNGILKQTQTAKSGMGKLGVLTTSADLLTLGNTIKNLKEGHGSLLDLAHDSVNVLSDFESKIPGIPAPIRLTLKLVPIIDFASQQAFGKLADKAYDPGDISKVGGKRAEEIIKEAERQHLTLEEYLKKRKKETLEEITPNDPNDIIGPTGPGADFIPENSTPSTRFEGFINDTGAFDYRIVFENKASASAPAQIVKVTHQLDSDLDFTTFTLGDFAFASFTIDVPEGRQAYSTRVDATATLGVYVDFDASVNSTGLVTWTLTSVDPVTNDLPLDPFAGFLHANVTPPEGDAFVRFSVAPKTGLASGTQIGAQATIIFDLEQPINTPLITNTIDNVAPTSTVTPFAAATTSRANFRVDWTAADAGSGILGTNIYVRDNGGPLQLVAFTNAVGSAAFKGGQIGHTYTFFSSATDRVNNAETIGLTPDATITVVAPTLISNKDTNGKLHIFTDTDGDTYTLALAGPGTLNVVLLDPDGDGKGSVDQLFLTGSTKASKVTLAVKRAKDGPDPDKLPDGDGLVSIGDLNVTGHLGSFTAKASDLTVGGIVATGLVGKVAVRDFAPADAIVAIPGITASGTALSKTQLALTARNIANGAAFTLGAPIASLLAASIGTGSITAPALGKLTTTIGGMNSDLTIAGAVGPVSIKGSVGTTEWAIGSIGPVLIGGSLSGDIDATGKIASVTTKNGAINGQLTATAIGPVRITGGGLGGFIGTSIVPAKTKALTSLTIVGGDLTGSLFLTGDTGPISVKENKLGVGGAVSGSLIARRFDSVTFTGGDFTGVITNTATAATLGKVAALKSLALTGGNLLGDISLLGTLGSLAVKAAAKTGPGGSLDGASITAAKIAAILVGKNVSNSLLLAGASLGADGLLGGGDDTFTPATIGPITIGGNLLASTIAAGLSTTNAILHDGDDSILGGTASTIASLIVKGNADNASYVATGKFKATPKFGTTLINPATDPRFLIA